LRAHRPEAVLSMSDLLGVPAALAAAIVGVPRVVVSARNEPPPLRRQTDSLLKPGYQAALAQERISLVTNCAATAQSFADWLDIPAASIGVVYNGVDVDSLIAQREASLVASHRRALGIPASARIVGSIFQARRQKRPRLWFLAAAAIARRAPDIAFVLVGDKLQGDEISAILAEHGLQDRFYRPGVQSDVANWLELMDVVLLTSETEGTPKRLAGSPGAGTPSRGDRGRRLRGIVSSRRDRPSRLRKSDCRGGRRRGVARPRRSRLRRARSHTGACIHSPTLQSAADGVRIPRSVFSAASGVHAVGRIGLSCRARLTPHGL
jgi:glycosyltransferase involved in cell wall biosynthesis